MQLWSVTSTFSFSCLLQDPTFRSFLSQSFYFCLISSTFSSSYSQACVSLSRSHPSGIRHLDTLSIRTTTAVSTRVITMSDFKCDSLSENDLENTARKAIEKFADEAIVRTRSQSRARSMGQLSGIDGSGESGQYDGPDQVFPRRKRTTFQSDCIIAQLVG